MFRLPLQMDVLLRLVTRSQKKRTLTTLTIFWIGFLGFTFQSGQALGLNNELIAPMNFNSPENFLRGIEINAPTQLDISEPDEFGYQWDDTVAYNWKDPAGALPISFSGSDDGFAGPIDIGFVFPFYENAYSQMYISTNGYISFFDLEGISGDSKSKPIPNDIAPNNFISPFWSDLVVGGAYNSGEVSTIQGSDGNGQFLQINFVNISKLSSVSDLLTFQVILYQNGDIWFQYNSLVGDLSAAIGLEDGDGLVGLPYTQGLINNLAIRFQRPGPEARVKVLPFYQSRLAQSGTGYFSLQIRNTGEIGADTYNITTQQIPNSTSAPCSFGVNYEDLIAKGEVNGSKNVGWIINLYHDEGGQELTDTNGDSIIDTGTIAQGETKTIQVQLRAVSEGIQGDYSTFLVSANSVLAPEKMSTSCFQTTIPAEHFIAFGNSAGLDLGRITDSDQLSFGVTGFGDNPALLRVGAQYFYTWEDADLNPGTDIEYAVLGYEGNIIHPVTKLTDNNAAIYSTRDNSPVLAVSPDNRVGVVWVREMFDDGPPLRGQNYNVYFAILDRDGNVLVEPLNVTNNGPCDPPEPDTCWQIGDDIDVPVYSSPTIMATSDNRFVISWVDSRILLSGDATNVGYVVYDTNGNSLMVTPDDIKNGFAGGDLFGEPGLIELQNDRMLVTYTLFNQQTQVQSLAFDVYEIVSTPATIGTDLQQDVLITGAFGGNPDSVMLKNSNILLAWTNTTSDQIEASILSDDGELISVLTDVPIPFPSPDGRHGNFVSVDATSNGTGVLSWADAEIGNRVYYALINSIGEVITPPLFAWVGTETITISQTGQGIASIPDWYVFMPILTR